MGRSDRAAGFPARCVRPNEQVIEWANGSRVVCMPDAPDSAVGFPPEHHRHRRGVAGVGPAVPAHPADARPGELLAGDPVHPVRQEGWFFQIFDTPRRLALFRHWRITAAQCPRISPAFLAEERSELGERWYHQEYFLAFNDAVDAVFRDETIRRAFQPTTRGPLFPVD